nr:UPF0182 family protein [Spelaeicoccus albus]
MPTIGIVVVLLILFVIFSQVYTEVLWFNQLHFLDVFTTTWITKAIMFVGSGVIMGGVIWYMMHIVYHRRPVYVPSTPQQENLDRYREAIEPLRKVMMVLLPIIIGLFAAASGGSNWKTVLEWLNRTPFGKTDPQFGHDISFYVFTLPWINYLVGFATAIVVVSFIISLVGHYLYGGIRPSQQRQIAFSTAARVQLSVLVGVFILLQAIRFWLNRYGTLFDSGGLITGAGYSDVNASIPAHSMLAIAAVIVGLLFIVSAVWGRWRLPVIGTALLIVMSIVAGGIYPWAIQRFQVKPSEQSLESTYIKRNIDATRAAYGIDAVKTSKYNPSPTGKPGALRKDTETTASIRLLDPNLVSDSFRQLQQIKQYYGFPNQLDVDRYNLDNEKQDTVIAVRGLRLNGIGSDSSWYNRRIVYTHGFGVVAAYGNKRADDGRPVFYESGIPPKGKLGKFEPRIYFGESSPKYSIVGAPKGAQARELDYPSDTAASGQVNYTYQGDAGPNVGNLFNRLAYAVKFQDEQIVLSDAVNKDSQILYNRKPRDRVKKVAPYLTIDGDPYPAVVNGRVKWIVDAYTTTRGYPYSTPQTLDAATEDSSTARAQNVSALPQNQVSYIRNSVKATVDAFDGSVNLYAWDPKDPVLKTWEKIYPGTVKPVSDISGDLMSHVRYPEDLFKVQRSLLGAYHVKSPGAFYSTQDYWASPNDPTAPKQVGAKPQPPYYLTLQMPKQSNPAFQLTSSFVPRTDANKTRSILTGFLAADSDAGDQKGKVSDQYGKLRLIQLPRDAAVPGPGQAENNFRSDPKVQSALNLLQQGDSKVEYGNLLTLPIGGGLLYVQPVYVRSAGETSYPLLQRVLVSFGEHIGFAGTLDEALDQVFGGNSGATAGDANAASTKGTNSPQGPEDTNGEGSEAPASAEKQLQSALKDAKKAMSDGKKALSNGDFGAYGKAQKRLSDAISRATAAQEKIKSAQKSSSKSGSDSGKKSGSKP